jgi:hypothetical protein
VVSSLEADQIANFCELYTDLQKSFFSKLAAERTPNLLPLEHAVGEMAGAVEQQDLERLLDARQRFMDAGFVLLNNFYLTAVLRGLVPAGLRLAHLAACLPTVTCVTPCATTRRFSRRLTVTMKAGCGSWSARSVVAKPSLRCSGALGKSGAPGDLLFGHML